MNKSVVLLSGGLDSVVSLGAFKDEYGIKLALTFDYGQKSAAAEINASSKICEYYKIEHRVIKLDWLKDITKTALVSDKALPAENFGTEKSMESVWVPNRNGLFLNIAASFCDSFGYNCIVFGANKDEGETFSDNTEKFRELISGVFEYSTLVKPRVAAPLINCTKNDIVKIAMDKSVPLEFVMSCYSDDRGVHCGKCESCLHLKRALEENNCYKYLDVLFKGR